MSQVLLKTWSSRMYRPLPGGLGGVGVPPNATPPFKRQPTRSRRGHQGFFWAATSLTTPVGRAGSLEHTPVEGFGGVSDRVRL